MADDKNKKLAALIRQNQSQLTETILERHLAEKPALKARL